MITLSPKLDLYTILLLIGVVQGIFISYFFFINRKNSSANIYLGSLVLVLTLSLVEVFMNYSGLTLSALPLHNFSEPLQLLVGPLFYFYIRAYLGKKMGTLQWLHLLPFIIYTGYMCVEYSMPIAQKYNSYIDTYYPEERFLEVEHYFDADPWDIKPFIFKKGVFIQLFLYLGLSLSIMRKEIAAQWNSLFKKNKTREQSNWIGNFLLITIAGIVLFAIFKIYV